MAGLYFLQRLFSAFDVFFKKVSFLLGGSTIIFGAFWA